MKIREGFVSNSSSTSFIAAIRKHRSTKTCKCCGITPIDFLLFLEEGYGHQGSDGSEMKTRDRLKIMETYKEQMAWQGYEKEKEDKFVKDMEDAIAKYPENEWDVALVQIGYHDQVVKALWKDMVANKSITIIEEV